VEVDEDEGGVVDGEVEADDELTSPSIERVDDVELSICQKTRQLSSPARDEKTNDDEGMYYSAASGAHVQQVVEQMTNGWS